MTNDHAVWLFEQPNYPLRPALLDWLTANNLNPEDIPVDATITVDENAGTITTDRFVRRDSNMVVDGDTVLCDKVTVPMAVRPPETIAHRLTFTGRAERCSTH
ncbi:hypothetical protein [Micromonospora carbonacea]|uniref:hypothetical protein n=1 Tax=Micromonospora carbonacea TaxID=47853 RepID=UPI003717BE88